MFVVREAHLVAMSRVSREEFEDRVALDLRRRHPQQCEALGEEGVYERIGEGIERARRHEIEIESDVAEFVDLMFAISPDFDTARATKWIRPILSETWVSGETRLWEIRTTAEREGLISKNGEVADA